MFIEEVRIPITAKDTNGRFDPTVELDDLMLRENGIVQPLKSVYRVPASVLLLLDTGGEVNLAKSVRLTRAVATTLVSNLRPDDQVAVMQVNNRVELLQPWTSTQSYAIKSFNQLLPGKRSALLSGLLAAIDQFKEIAPGNKHLVLMSDGIDRGGKQPDLSEAFRSLVAANVTVHIISYASLGMKVAQPSATRPRVKSAVPKELIIALPRTQFKEDDTPDLRTMMLNKGGMVLDVDMLFRRKGLKAALVARSKEFSALTEETGGYLWMPASADEMIQQAEEIAHDVDSQYVITYKPLQPLNPSMPNEYRLIDVISRRVGLTVRARRGYVAKVSSASEH
ncbi:MAG TPA: VWA domain-containing protein [Pyrinomonadaceae bacterium]|nr:VWA domain-containing protein [Pyrinomonadaceae bacterium]